MINESWPFLVTTFSLANAVHPTATISHGTSTCGAGRRGVGRGVITMRRFDFGLSYETAVGYKTFWAIDERLPGGPAFIRMWMRAKPTLGTINGSSRYGHRT